MWVGSFDSGQQTANYKSPSPLPGHALVTTYSTLATDPIDCHYKRPRWIYLYHSVIETWGWARLTRGSKQPIIKSPSSLPSHTLATTVKYPSNSNPRRHILKSECHRHGGWFI